MKSTSLLTTALAVLSLHAVALSQVDQPQNLPTIQSARSEVSMCVTTAIGTCGDFCQPFECTPNYTLVSSFENMRVDVAGAPGTAYVLFYGMAVPGCLPVPGVEGAMATWTPAAVVALGAFEDVEHRPDLPCLPATRTLTISVPAVRPGIDVRFQLLGMNANLRARPQLSFSRATEVRTR